MERGDYQEQSPLILRQGFYCMSADLKKKLEELGRIENRLRREERKLADLRRAMKEQLLAGASIESGNVYAELRLLPGRDPSSKNPDDYDLILSYVS